LGSSNTVRGFRCHAFGNSVAATSNSVWIGSSTNGSSDQNVIAANFDLNSLADMRDFPAINIYENGVGIKGLAHPSVSLYVKGINFGGNATTGLRVDADYLPNSYAAQFNGPVQINGNLYGTQFGYSDAKFKTNQSGIFNASDIIDQLQPKSFYFDTASYSDMNFNRKKQFGFIAQDVENVLPDVVVNSSTAAQYDTAGNVTKASINFKAVNYDAFIAILVANAKEQKVRIDHQDSLINQLSTMIQSCCLNQNARSSSGAIASQEVELSDKNIVVLDQNVPNPFAEQTTILYNIPEDFKFAQILFHNNLGQLIKVVDVKQKGRGQLNVFANDLSNGIYSYTLIIDGKNIDTKKMLKTQ
jgi:hypothetical protein